ncbi:hypothetical protein C8J48_0172 [Desmospora activa DSM 45169]|uniref:Uncharacterized protein n=1 Tax=Desmospora activa DSM 45169 TaxID=1121389 RepID=A0A2T4Z6V7_9BACL|nr:hypothetical protein C8J48_0172 [Desmospora activa DSM 45169]
MAAIKENENEKKGSLMSYILREIRNHFWWELLVRGIGFILKGMVRLIKGLFQ